MASYLPSSSGWETDNEYVKFRLYITESTSSKTLTVKFQVYKDDASTANSTATCKITWYLNGSSLGTDNLGSTTVKANSTWTTLKTRTITLANSATSATLKVTFNMSGCSIGTTTKYDTFNLKTYELSYDPNKGTGTISPVKKCYKNTVTLNKGTNFKRDGYRLLGWATTSTATKASYSLGGSYTMPAKAVTMYAIWSQNEYVITYNANGGTNEPEPQDKKGGVDIKLSSTIPKRPGYTFLGWAKSSTGSVVYQPGDTYSTNADLDLYAKWKANSYTLTLNPNYPGCTTTDLTLRFNTMDYYGIGVYTPVRIGYRFLGWFTASGVQIYDESGEAINEGIYWENDTYCYPGDLTVYANWESLNVAYYKYNGDYVLTNTYIKINGEWQSAILYQKINENYERSVVY